MNSTVPYPNSQWYIKTTMEILGMDRDTFASSILTPGHVIEEILRGNAQLKNDVMLRISKATGIEYHLGMYLASELGSGAESKFQGLRETLKEAYRKDLEKKYDTKQVKANM